VKPRQESINVSTASPTTNITNKKRNWNHSALSEECPSLQAVLISYRNKIEY
jgi:hypothetical protein